MTMAMRHLARLVVLPLIFVISIITSMYVVVVQSWEVIRHGKSDDR